MAENDTQRTKSQFGKIEQILRERERLDEIIQENFQKKMTVFFSDVCGFTQYLDKWGDIKGRAWIQKYHDIVLPTVEKNGGKVLDLIGDGVMASFSTTLSAVKASVAVQKSLDEYNRAASQADEIHVRIGINTGEMLVDEDRTSGNAVNVASRIQDQAGPDQILIERSVYEEICGSEDILCRFHGTARVRGKPEALELYRVIWQEKDIVRSTEVRGQVRKVPGGKKVRPPSKVLQLEITREGDHLNIGAHEQRSGEVSTIRHYEEKSVSIDRIGARCREIVETLNNANRKGRLSREVLTKLRNLGQVLRDELFTLDVKEKIKEAKGDHLVLNLDDQLVHIPWELLHDGRTFLCQRFNMGRLVKTRQTLPGTRARSLGRPFKMLILADPKGDLKGAYQEGIRLRNFMDGYKEFVSVSLRSDGVTADLIKEKMRNFDLVHFAGHAEHDPQNPAKGGWRLSDGILRAQDIVSLAGTGAMPALIFSNACQSARTEAWRIKEDFENEIFGLANAFILAGVRHYVGTFWEIQDEPSMLFAMESYKGALSGMTVGGAVREARRALIRKYGEETIVWASYVLYGDPTINYADQVMQSEEKEEPEHASLRRGPVEVRAKEEIIDFGEVGSKKKKWRWLGLAGGIVVLLYMLLFGYPGLWNKGTVEYESAALSHYSGGDFDQALKTCEILEETNPKGRLAYLIQGNIHLTRGELDAAEVSYRKGLKAPKGTNIQEAEIFMGLGRVASLKKDQQGALEYYRRATNAAPGSELGYLSQALILEDKGDYDSALSLLAKAHSLAPQDQVLAAMKNEINKRVALGREREKRERIDQLVKELLESLESPPLALPTDGWTSTPLTLLIMHFEVQGCSLREGEERLLTSGISEHLLAYSRVQVVERAVLDKLLEELRLSTSKLADPSAALSLGKILAARIILAGRLVYSGPQTQVSMRLIETETGRILSAMNELFGAVVPVSTLTKRLSEGLLERLEEFYPLRGKISEVKDNEVILNIGQEQGAAIGTRFKVIDTDLVLEVISIRPDGCVTRVVKGQKKPEADMRVEGITISQPS